MAAPSKTRFSFPSVLSTMAGIRPLAATSRQHVSGRYSSLDSALQTAASLVCGDGHAYD